MMNASPSGWKTTLKISRRTGCVGGATTFFGASRSRWRCASTHACAPGRGICLVRESVPHPLWSTAEHGQAHLLLVSQHRARPKRSNSLGVVVQNNTHKQVADEQEGDEHVGHEEDSRPARVSDEGLAPNAHRVHPRRGNVSKGRTREEHEQCGYGLHFQSWNHCHSITRSSHWHRSKQHRTCHKLSKFRAAGTQKHSPEPSAAAPVHCACSVTSCMVH